MLREEGFSPLKNASMFDSQVVCLNWPRIAMVVVIFYWNCYSNIVSNFTAHENIANSSTPTVYPTYLCVYMVRMNEICKINLKFSL